MTRNARICLLSRYFHSFTHRNKFAHKIVMAHWIDSSSCNVVNTSLPARSSPDLAKHDCCHRSFQLSPCNFFIVSLKSSSAGSTKCIPHNFLALSSFGFSMPHFCFRCDRFPKPCTPIWIFFIRSWTRVHASDKSRSSSTSSSWNWE